MRNVQPDSPQALACVLATVMGADTGFDARELKVLDDMSAYDLLGIGRDEFLRTARAYRAEFARRMSDRDHPTLSEVTLIDEVLSSVQDPRARLAVSALVQRIITADGRVDEHERRLFDHMLWRFGLTRGEVARALLQPQPLH